MKIRFLGESQSNPSTPRLLRGGVYFVLSLTTDLRSKTTKAVVLDDNQRVPVQVDAAVFEVTEQSIPPNWEISVTMNRVCIAPREWQSESFWADYFLGKQTAVEEFDRILPTVYLELSKRPIEDKGIQ